MSDKPWCYQIDCPDRATVRITDRGLPCNTASTYACREHAVDLGAGDPEFTTQPLSEPVPAGWDWGSGRRITCRNTAAAGETAEFCPEIGAIMVSGAPSFMPTIVPAAVVLDVLCHAYGSAELIAWIRAMEGG